MTASGMAGTMTTRTTRVMVKATEADGSGGVDNRNHGRGTTTSARDDATVWAVEVDQIMRSTALWEQRNRTMK